MKLSKPLICCNVAGLVINAVIVWATLIHDFPPLLGITVFIACLAGAVWFSCYLNGRLPRKTDL